jgi:hypothetical protein
MPNPFLLRWSAIFTALLAACALLTPVRATAQSIKPWVPPSADSLLAWSAEATVRFKANQGDTVGGTNYRAYELVGIMGRKLLRSLGRKNLLQSNAIEPVLDSLGLDTTVEFDPTFPDFVMMIVRNPYNLTAHAVGFIYWYRGNDLRMQGALVYGGFRPSVRAWWNRLHGSAVQPGADRARPQPRGRRTGDGVPSGGHRRGLGHSAVPG